MARRVLEQSGLKEWQKWLVSLENTEVKNTQSRILRSSGLRALEHLDDYTPVRTGRLRGSMSMGGPDNVFKLQAGNRGYVFVGTAVPYAEQVNDGWTMTRGQYVPGEWRSGTFHYIPQHHRGIILSGKVIPGRHMFERAMDDLENDLGAILEYEFRRLYQKLFS
ncbi:HK97 gp10 family phage protein [Paenibacillus sinopodophylli]|uniref:HK97 gp10 family phage protein n=1 Tax=Paenibacillus sinopodophylli TaxID=1837342 RepID=UPI00110CD37B|nr:HK97 gp10 family phage protein [Paenibacillus sinopodophylli]